MKICARAWGSIGRRFERGFLRCWLPLPAIAVLLGAAGVLLLTASSLEAESLVLRDGRILEGALGTVSGMADNPLAPPKPQSPQIRSILMVDDNLRRTFFPKSQYTSVQQSANGGQPTEKIRIPQRVAIAGARLGRVGPIVNVTPFDEQGRRIFTMMSDRGPLDVIQGITEITPLYTKVEGLQGKQPFVWDMRLATSSIPRETLSKVIARVIDPKKLDQRLQLVRLLLQAERYQDAQKELETIVKEFPGNDALENEIRAIRQLHSRRVIEEVNSRRRAGQHRLAYNMLESFPRKEVAGETLEQVRQLLDEYSQTREQGKTVLDSIEQHLAQIKEPKFQEACAAICKEISSELNINTLDRMADYLRLSDEEKLSADEKLSLAISGWLLGSNHASTNLAVSASLVEVRELVRSYLNEPAKVRRNAILTQLHSQEGSTPDMVARLIAHMKPPLETPGDYGLHAARVARPVPTGGPETDAGTAEDKHGFFELQVPSLDKEPDVTYYVQLPPEYDPYRRYPTIVTLNGSGTTPLQQVDWWAGSVDAQGSRLGQATRLGYVVVAVDWAKPDQKEYEYSAREHAAVLISLRDACRRFSIDTDRVFLSGHSMGGDAAWDMALSHPDQWAGVIPIVAVSDKYCALYWENAGLVPFYVVAGELDGDKTVRNARDLDRYLTHRYDVTVVEYLGRGHEHFHDEIQRIFDWMGRRERNFFPKKFTSASMRTWDNYFWWIELGNYAPSSIVEPSNWPPPRNYQPVRVDASIKNNTIYITSGAGRVSVWLSPELIDFGKPVKITFKGKRLNKESYLQPDLTTILEDVRTRGERLHPFWVKVE